MNPRPLRLWATAIAEAPLSTLATLTARYHSLHGVTLYADLQICTPTTGGQRALLLALLQRTPLKQPAKARQSGHDADKESAL